MKPRVLIIVLVLALSGAPAVAQSGDTAAWSEVEGFQLGKGSPSPTGIAALPGGELVMVGRSGSGRGHAWFSEDGETWEVVKLPRRKDAEAFDVIGTAQGAVAIGTLFTNTLTTHGLVWTTEDGKTWSGPTRIKNADFSAIAEEPSGLAILGTTAKGNGPRHPTVWRSTDGVDWRPSRIAKGARQGMLVFGKLAVTPGGLWVATALDVGGDYLAWRSTDGEQWEAIGLPRPDPEQPIRVPGLVATESGVILAVNSYGDSSTTGSVWYLQPGTDWAQVFESGNPLGAMGLIDGRPVIMSVPPLAGETVTDRAGSLLSSVDGQEWTELPAAGLDGAATTSLAAAPGDQMIVIGYSVPDGLDGDIHPLAVGDPTAWLAELPIHPTEDVSMATVSQTSGLTPT